MNENHSTSKWIYKRRWLEGRLADAVRTHPVTIVTGARQVGKSTLLRHAEPVARWRYLSLDDLDVLALAEKSPEELWAGTDTVVIDEAQRIPSLFLAVKKAVDRERKRRFVLSGSANLLLLHRVSESLAGRAVYLVLGPMTLGERSGKPAPDILRRLLRGSIPDEGKVPPAPDPLGSAIVGFMPATMWLPSQEAAIDWWSGYVMTYLERDLRDLSQVASLSDFRRVMEITALRTGRILNQTEVARDAGVSQPTVHRYLNLLEISFLLHRLPAYAVSRTKRLIKSPKIYWADPGLATFLMGHYSAEELRESREAGPVFENLVLLHLRVLAELLRPPARLHYWRTVTGAEVDFVLEWGRSLLAFEVKLGRTARHQDAKSLRLFLSEYPGCALGVLVYCGDEIVRLGEKIVALPWQVLAGF